MSIVFRWVLQAEYLQHSVGADVCVALQAGAEHQVAPCLLCQSHHPQEASGKRTKTVQN